MSKSDANGPEIPDFDPITPGDVAEVHPGSPIFRCCYCDQVVEGPIFTFAAVGAPPNQHEQYWFGHLSCFAARLHPHYRDFREEFEQAIDAEEGV